MKRIVRTSPLTGAVLFFISIAAVVTVTVLVYALVESTYTGQNTVIAVIMLVVIICLAAIATVLDYLRRRFNVYRSVEKILEATDKIASGDFSTRIDIPHSYSKYDHFDHIMENLNKMAEELAATEVLHNDFISNVSHEIKTPLSIIQNYATLLQSKKIDEKTRIQYADILVKTSQKLTLLVTNILKLNKLENQKIRPEYEQIDLAEMLSQTVIDFEDIIEKKNLKIDCDFADDVKIFSSPGYLDIVWNNLLSNAIKFTEHGGTISLSLKKENGLAVVRVSDTGCGISSETGKHIFEKFYQGDTSHSQEGNGLGLALIKKVIDIIGGRIDVKSELGKGTTFTITLQAEV